MSAAVSFGRFELRPASRELMAEGQPMALGARAFDLLQALIERRERLVTKHELLDLVWPGVVVEENNLQVQISTLRKLLGPVAIATIPGRGYRFAVPIATELPDATKVTPASPCLTPRVSSSLPDRRDDLFGRADDLSALQQLLFHPLVTIVGPGGIGKTRLAAALTDTDLHAPATHAVAWVDLAPLSDGTLIPSTIAAAANVWLDDRHDAIDALLAALKNRSLLIVLDNCEHVIEAVASVASALIQRTQTVRLLATSRAPLRIGREQVYRLRPLALPEKNTPLREAEKCGAVALFVARCRAADRHFELNQQNVAAVIDVCTRLDGIPLALELAAARLQSLGLSALAAMLDQRFRLLTSGSRTAPPRQQTMHATFDWSYGFLSPIEQLTFRRIGVFAGGFSLEATRAVVPDEASDPWDVIDALSSLVDKSLVAVDGEDQPRYHLLESARVFALEKLEEAGEMTDVQGRHAMYFRQFFNTAYQLWPSTPDTIWVALTHRELDNMRAALNWSLSRAAEGPTGVALAGASLLIWLDRDHHFRDEGRRFVRAALQLLDPAIAAVDAGRLWLAHGLLTPFSDSDTALTSFERAASLCSEGGSGQSACHALLECGRMLTRKGRFDAAEQALRQAHVLLNHALVPKLQGIHCGNYGFLSQMTGDFVKAQSFFRAALKWFVDSGSEALRLHALNDVGDVTWALEDLESAADEFREAVRLARGSRFANEGAIGVPLGNLAGVLIEQGNLEEAAPVAREALALLTTAETAWTFCDSLALRLALLGRCEDAARLLGFADAAHTKGSQMREVNEQRLRTRLLSLLSARFEETELSELMRGGRDLSEKEALSIAL